MIKHTFLLNMGGFTKALHFTTNVNPRTLKLDPELKSNHTNNAGNNDEGGKSSSFVHMKIFRKKTTQERARGGDMIPEQNLVPEQRNSVVQHVQRPDLGVHDEPDQRIPEMDGVDLQDFDSLEVYGSRSDEDGSNDSIETVSDQLIQQINDRRDSIAVDDHAEDIVWERASGMSAKSLEAYKKFQLDRNHGGELNIGEAYSAQVLLHKHFELELIAYFALNATDSDAKTKLVFNDGLDKYKESVEKILQHPEDQRDIGRVGYHADAVHGIYMDIIGTAIAEMMTKNANFGMREVRAMHNECVERWFYKKRVEIATFLINNSQITPYTLRQNILSSSYNDILQESPTEDINDSSVALYLILSTMGEDGFQAFKDSILTNECREAGKLLYTKMAAANSAQDALIRLSFTSRAPISEKSAVQGEQTNVHLDYVDHERKTGPGRLLKTSKRGAILGWMKIVYNSRGYTANKNQHKKAVLPKSNGSHFLRAYHYGYITDEENAKIQAIIRDRRRQMDDTAKAIRIQEIFSQSRFAVCAKNKVYHTFEKDNYFAHTEEQGFWASVDTQKSYVYAFRALHLAVAFGYATPEIMQIMLKNLYGDEVDSAEKHFNWRMQRKLFRGEAPQSTWLKPKRGEQTKQVSYSNTQEALLALSTATIHQFGNMLERIRETLEATGEQRAAELMANIDAFTAKAGEFNTQRQDEDLSAQTRAYAEKQFEFYNTEVAKLQARLPVEVRFGNLQPHWENMKKHQEPGSGEIITTGIPRVVSMMLLNSMTTQANLQEYWDSLKVTTYPNNEPARISLIQHGDRFVHDLLAAENQQVFRELQSRFQKLLTDSELEDFYTQASDAILQVSVAHKIKVSATRWKRFKWFMKTAAQIVSTLSSTARSIIGDMYNYCRVNPKYKSFMFQTFDDGSKVTDNKAKAPEPPSEQVPAITSTFQIPENNDD